MTSRCADSSADSDRCPASEDAAAGCGAVRAAAWQNCSSWRGRSEFEDGTGVSCETSRRLTCDASVVRVVHDGRGSVLDVGRPTRTIPPALRRALEVRDGGCRFPGCAKVAL